MASIKVLLIAAAILSVAAVSAEETAPAAHKLVQPRILKPKEMMPKHRVIIVPKGDARARDPAQQTSPVPAAPFVAPTTPAPTASRVLKAARTCASLQGTCKPRAQCTNGVVVSGLCGSGSNYCCTPKAATPSQPPATQPTTPSAPVDTSSCPIFGGLPTINKTGNKKNGKDQVFAVAATPREYLTDPRKYGLPDHLSDNTVKVQPTGCAFGRMAQAAAKQGVSMKISSGFRTYARQEYFWRCMHKCTADCTDCNQAAFPGNSNHGEGQALDLNTDCGKQPSKRRPAPAKCKNSKVYMYLLNNYRTTGFVRAVPSEPWHWEYKPGAAMPDYAFF